MRMDEQVREALRRLAAECHALAVKRGKYPEEWVPFTGCNQILEEVSEWCDDAMHYDVLSMHIAPGEEVIYRREAAELGDLLATVLSIAHHRGIDPAAALEGAIRRNRERAGRGES